MRSVQRLLRRIRTLTPSERRLFLRALPLLCAARLRLCVVPLRTLVAQIAVDAARMPPATGPTEPAAAITRAVVRAGRAVPGASCLTQALVAHALLLRYGHSSQLQIGVRVNAQGSVEAHAWVESGGAIVIGFLPDLPTFTPLPTIEPKPLLGCALQACSVEQELVLLCARPVCDEGATARLLALAGGSLDWSRVYAQAKRWRVVPLVHRALQRVCPTLVPTALRATLDTFSNGVAQRNLLLLGGLLELSRAFSAAGLPVVSFKGPLLARQAYGSLALRESSDLDVLIHDGDAERAIALLHALGFERSAHPDYAALFTRARDGLVVELHWWAVGFSEAWQTVSNHLTVPINLAHVQAHLGEEQIAGTPVATLAPEDLLLILCLHGAKHRWALLGWVCDVAFLVQTHPHLDWERVFADGKRLGSLRMLRLGLLLAASLLQIPLPAQVAAKVGADPAVASLAESVATQLLRPGLAAPTLWSEVSFCFRLWDRKQDRLRFAGYYAYCYARAVASPQQKSLPKLW
jgi:hypothetical protein